MIKTAYAAHMRGSRPLRALFAVLALLLAIAPSASAQEVRVWFESRFQPWALDKLAKLSVSFFDPAFILSTLLDRLGAGWYYRQTLSGLFRTFWTSLAADRTDRPPTPAASSYLLMLLTF